MAIINKSIIRTNPLILFSEYRAELMGIAIIGVLIGHTIILGNITINNTFIKFLNIIPRLAFTQGFLFLSGFGLCYSFTKNNNIKQFYLKRIKRLLIPFIILSAWYYLFQDLIENRNFIGFLIYIVFSLLDRRKLQWNVVHSHIHRFIYYIPSMLQIYS